MQSTPPKYSLTLTVHLEIERAGKTQCSHMRLLTFLAKPILSFFKK